MECETVERPVFSHGKGIKHCGGMTGVCGREGGREGTFLQGELAGVCGERRMYIGKNLFASKQASGERGEWRKELAGSLFVGLQIRGCRNISMAGVLLPKELAG